MLWSRTTMNLRGPMVSLAGLPTSVLGRRATLPLRRTALWRASVRAAAAVAAVGEVAVPEPWRAGAPWVG